MINATNIWQFSSSSKMQLQRCLSAAKFDCHNKWIQKLKIKAVIIENDMEKHTEEIAEATQEPMDIEETRFETEEVKETEQNVDFFREVIDVDPVANFNVIVDMCVKDKNVYRLLLKNLSISSIEKICNHIFLTKDLNPEFLESFYTLFLPAFLKKEHTWLSLDVLVKAKESHGVQFKILVSILLNEKEFPSNVLQEFVSTLNTNELTSFINDMVINDISNEMFGLNMYTIFLAYKECRKNDHIQNYILKTLTQIAHDFVNDKNYGRFLLTFIQSQKDVTNLARIEKIVELHRSAFKRPCVNALNSLKN